MAYGGLKGFLYDVYVRPGYDWVDTLTYGILLAFAVFGIIPLLKRLKVCLDWKFVWAVAPFIVFGGTARELVDQGLGVYAGAGPYPQNFWMVAPTIYLTMFVFASLVLLLSRLAARENYHKPMLVFGVLLCAYNFSLIAGNIEDPAALGYILAAFSLSGLIVLYASRWLRFLLYEKNYLVVFAHLLDASATFVGVDVYGFSEKHVLPTLLINKFGSAAVMFPLKLLVVVPALYLIDRELSDDATGRRFVKLVVLILGAGPAIRDITLTVL